MGAWKWLRSGLKIATGWIPGVGTAVEEGLDHWAEHRERRSALASLLDVRGEKGDRLLFPALPLSFAARFTRKK